MSNLDYFKQIARGEIVTSDVLEKRYKEFLNFINKLKASEVDRLQELIQLRYDFLVASKLLEGYNAGLSYRELKDGYDKIFEIAIERKQDFNNKARLRDESINPYRNLSVPQNAENYRINISYIKQIERLEKDLEKEEDKQFKDIDNIVSLYSYYILFREAKEILLDSNKRRAIDEEISLGLNPNQEDLYSENVVSNLKFIPNRGLSIAYEVKNKYGDIISFEHMGSLEYGQFGKRNPLFKDRETLQKYKIHKIYNSMPNSDGSIKEKEYEIFTFININQMSSDEVFTAAHANLLFSDVNIEEAIKHNGGYAGEIEYNEGKIVLNHSQDKLCACKEYSRKMMGEN